MAEDQPSHPHGSARSPSLRVNDRSAVTMVSVVVGFGFDGWTSAQSVHEPAGVVPVHPGGGDLFEIGDATDRPGTERGSVSDALGPVQPDGRFREGVVEGVPDRPDRWDESLERQGLADPDRGVLRAGVGVVDRLPVQRAALPTAVGRGLGGSPVPRTRCACRPRTPTRRSGRRTRRSRTCSSSGRSAAKHRLTRSGARVAAGSAIVVRTLLARLTPRQP
jgi:hypothetical protein